MMIFQAFRFPGKWLIVLVNLLGLLALTNTLVAGAIDLLYFRAKPGANSILLQWATASEFDISGFYIVRSLSQETGYSRISPFIFAKAEDSLVGAEYEYEDKSVNKGVLYYYKLEVLSTNTSQSSEFHGPISASIGGVTPSPTSSPTPTSTVTPTLIFTVTPTPNVNPTRRSTATSTITATLSPTSSQGQNPGALPTQTQNPDNPYPPVSTDEILQETNPITGTTNLNQATATLIPFPEITIEFPENPKSSHTIILPTASVTPKPNSSSPVNYWFIGILLVIWAGLGFLAVRFFIHRN
jgi:hypothetical protein